MNGQSCIIVSDFDDTIAFSGKAIGVASTKITGKSMTRAEVRALEDHDLKAAIYELAKKRYFYHFRPNAAAVDFIRARKSEGCEVVILSAGMDDMIGETQRLLENYEVPYDSLIMRHDRNSKDEDWKKSMVARLTDSHTDIILLEDKAENIDFMLSALDGKKVSCYLASEKDGLRPYP